MVETLEKVKLKKTTGCRKQGGQAFEKATGNGERDAGQPRNQSGAQPSMSVRHQ